MRKIDVRILSMIGRELDKERSFLNVVFGNLFQIRNHYITFLTLVKLDMFRVATVESNSRLFGQH